MSQVPSQRQKCQGLKRHCFFQPQSSLTWVSCLRTTSQSWQNGKTLKPAEHSQKQLYTTHPVKRKREKPGDSCHLTFNTYRLDNNKVQSPWLPSQPAKQDRHSEGVIYPSSFRSSHQNKINSSLNSVLMSLPLITERNQGNQLSSRHVTNSEMWTCPCHLPRPQFKA